MEKIDFVVVVFVDFVWFDVGLWLVLWDVLVKDDGENVVCGDVIFEGVENCLVMLMGVKVGVIGCYDLVVVVIEDVVLVIEKLYDQKVKLIVEVLKKEGCLDFFQGDVGGGFSQYIGDLVRRL